MVNKGSDSEGTDLFRQVLSSVRPIKQDKITPHKDKKKSRPHKRKTEEKETEFSALSDHSPETVGAQDELLFKRSGVQNSVIRKLRKGQFDIEAQLDLHRLTVAEARETIAGFLAHAAANNIRCVRIIHGKGQGSPEGKPILKIMVNNWLKQRDDVLAFCSAKRNDGGTGAIYALLRQQKK